MIYLSLFWEFLKIGLFSFGGAYGAIPIIQQAASKRGWLDEEMFSNILAVSESTPGPIMVNAATYIGSIQGGFLGAAVATLGVILPAFVIILALAIFLKRVTGHWAAQAVLSGVKPCVMGIIFAAGTYMLLGLVVTNAAVDFSALAIAVILAAVIVLYRKIRKKEFSPIMLICAAAILGIIFY